MSPVFFKFIMRHHINCFIGIEMNSVICKISVSSKGVFWTCLAQPAFKKPLADSSCQTLFPDIPHCFLHRVAWS